MPEANYCSRSLTLHTIDPCAPIFDNRSLTQVRGEHIAVGRGHLMTRQLRRTCTDKSKRHEMLVDENPRLDRAPQEGAKLSWESHVKPGRKAFPRTLALYHPLREHPIASMRLSPLAPRGRDTTLMSAGLLVRQSPDSPLDDFAATDIAETIRRSASLVDMRNGFLLSLERFVGHLGDPTLNAVAMLQALVKLVVDAPRRVEGLITPVPSDSSFLRLLTDLEKADLAPVRHLGDVNARLLRFTEEGILKDTRTIELHILHLDVLHMRHTLELLDDLDVGDPARRLLDTAILTRTFLKQHLAKSRPRLLPMVRPARNEKQTRGEEDDGAQ